MNPLPFLLVAGAIAAQHTTVLSLGAATPFLPAGDAVEYHLPAHHGGALRVAVDDHGRSRLRLQVLDQDGRVVAADDPILGRGRVVAALRAGRTYRIRVTNVGTAPTVFSVAIDR